MKCKECGKEYNAKRSTSLYCSPKCKQEFYRNRMSKPVTLSNAKPVTVTPTVTRVLEPAITLHPAIIAQINRLTMNEDGTVNEQARKVRMAIAYDYERKFPGRPYTGAGL